VRVPPKLMAHARESARTHGKSDPMDALAVARAAPREPDLPRHRSGEVQEETHLGPQGGLIISP
jgi:transposase